MSEQNIRWEITPGAVLMVVFFLLLRQPSLLWRGLLAAAIHEAGHLAGLFLFRVPVKKLRWTALGLELEASLLYLSYPGELLVLLAGPLFNLLGLLAAALMGHYTMAGLHLFLGCFNLLPILPLDGGRCLEVLLCWLWDPVRGDTVSLWVSRSCAAALTVGALLLIRQSGGNLFLLAPAAGLLFQQISLVKPCRKR